ncbi:MAG: Na/Pi symporter [Bacteroidales bacterium]|nr:Na/Pi symporter [Bacteroidales bacterium]
MKLEKPRSEEVYRFSGDGQTQTVNTYLERSVKTRVVDGNGEPREGYPVYFRKISAPENALGFILSDTLIYTDSTGLASIRVKLGDEPGEYELAAFLQDSPEKNFLVYHFSAREKQWGFFVIIGLIGGLGLFLLGMTMMSEGMRSAAGDRMRSVLSHLTNNKFMALGVGTLLTTIIQSSSASTVMLVSFVHSRLMKFRQTLGIILGAGIGTTITAQVIAFNLTDYALLMIGLGFILNFFVQSLRVKYIGRIILGFGVLFFGMHVMSQSMVPLKDYSPFINGMLELEAPLIGILVGAIFTALVQSSSAFIGIMVTLSVQGLLTLEASVPLILGANIGTSATALLASISTSSEAKKVAIAHTASKFFGALLFVWWIPGFVDLIREISFIEGSVQGNPGSLQSTPRQIANAHTVFNVALALILFPFMNHFASLIDRLIREKEPVKKPAFSTVYLDKNVLKSSAPLALNLAKEEVLRMGGIVEDMLKYAVPPFFEKDETQLNYIEEKEKEVNFLRDKIKEYLLRISRQDIEAERLNEAFQLIYTVKEFEQIADTISSNIAQKAHSWCASDLEFSEEGRREIADYHTRALKQVNRAIEVLREVNLEKAKHMKKKFKKYRNMAIELEKQHYERLKEEVNKSISSSKTHLELLGLLKVINERATNIARILLKWSEKG